MKYIQALLVKIPAPKPHGALGLIMLEEVRYGLFDFEKRKQICEFIKEDSGGNGRPRTDFWIYQHAAGTDCIGHENHAATPLKAEDLYEILSKNDGLCYVQTTDSNELSSPSNGRGDRAILIHIKKPAGAEKPTEAKAETAS